MSVSNHEPLHFAVILHQVGDVRNDKIDTQHIVLGESQAAVNHNYAVPILKCSHIHSDLFQPTERNNL